MTQQKEIQNRMPVCAVRKIRLSSQVNSHLFI